MQSDLNARSLALVAVATLGTTNQGPTAKGRFIAQDGSRVCDINTPYYVQTATSNPVQIIETRFGKNYVFLAKEGQIWLGDKKNDRVRSEMQSRIAHDPGARVLVEYKVKVSVEPTLTTKSMVIGQFHATPDKGDFEGYPALEIDLEPGGLAVYSATVSERYRRHSYKRQHRASQIPFRLDEWHKISIVVEFDYKDEGFLCVNLDNKKVFCRGGISIGMNDRFGPYWKFGIYYTPTERPMRVKAVYKDLRLQQVGRNWRCQSDER